MSDFPTVFFVDDSATMREVLRSAFRRESLNVITCSDPTQALALIEQTAPDVVISDIVMPGKDGLELCRDIRRHPRLANTAVILVSSVVDRTVAEKAFAVKADELIRKPFQPQDLIARVRQLVGDRTAGRPSPPAAKVMDAKAERAAVFAADPEPVLVAAAACAPFQADPLPTPAALAPAAAAVLVAATHHVPAPPAEEVPAAAPPADEASAIAPAQPAAAAAAVAAAAPRRPGKLALELARCQALIKKLEAQAAAEREYVQTLEAQLRAFHETEE